MNNADMPASPATDSNGPFMQGMNPSIGLTKREAFAMAAMQGLCANPNKDLVARDAEQMAYLATEQADCLLSALQGDNHG